MPDASSIQFDGISLFIDPKPRAVFATFANVLHLTVIEYSLAKLVFLLLWLYLLFTKLYECLHVNKIFSGQGIVWLGLSVLFAFGLVAFLTINLGYIDVVAYTFSLGCVLLATSRFAPSWRSILGIWILGFLAILTHEKSLFDLAIIGIWIWWQRGFKVSFITVVPALMAAILFLYLVSQKVTSGLPPATYIGILKANPLSIVPDSFNAWGILLGGGSLWILYFILSIAMVCQAGCTKEKYQSLLATLVMGALCIAPLIIASDTNRMVDLIWMPCLLLICTLQWPGLFSSILGKILLVGLCAVQLLTPPFLMYNHGVVPMNCYASYFARQLPLEAEVKPRKWGVFSLHAFYRSDTSQKACDGL
jgi:hypothetical protein